MRSGFYLLAGLLAAAALLTAHAQSGIFLDVGNDTDYEWAASTTFAGPETVEATGSVNRYVRGGCWCIGCIYDPASGNCTVPTVLKSEAAGNLSVDDVKVTFSRSTLVSEVAYGEPHRFSDGGCWRIQYGREPDLFTPDTPIPQGYSCDGVHQYTFESHSHPNTDDAVDDAVYRLLNETLDLDGDGVMDIPYRDNMTFDAEGRIGVQTLWGPMEMRLIVWV